ncbi:MAG TPA: energy transducer TonB [Candidatus Acidoferrum sp.]|nr:energy transducer TonB [Candidatus Acidoferrum sp.]
MPSEPRKSSEEIHETTLGSLKSCLVEGDPEQQTRERKVRRRALVISILTQCTFLAALILVPLLGKTERIALAREYVPIPPYGHPHARSRTTTENHGGRAITSENLYVFSRPNAKPVSPTTGDDGAVGPPDFNPSGGGEETGPACSWCVDIGEKNSGPRPPQPVSKTPEKPRIVHMTQLDPARLIRRVEPVYPTLAIQTHREGRVELRAIIATDGTIQSLQIVGGDPIFYLSAREAVSQWRYQPTILNGQTVEIDTYITVIYTMQH